MSVRKQTGSVQLILLILMLACLVGTGYLAVLLEGEMTETSEAVVVASSTAQAIAATKNLSSERKAAASQNYLSVITDYETSSNEFIRSRGSFGAGYESWNSMYNVVSQELQSQVQLSKEIRSNFVKLNGLANGNPVRLEALDSYNLSMRKMVQMLSGLNTPEVTEAMSLVMNSSEMTSVVRQEIEGQGFVYKEEAFDAAWAGISTSIKSIHSKLSSNLIPNSKTNQALMTDLVNKANDVRRVHVEIIHGRTAFESMEKSLSDFHRVNEELSTRLSAFIKSSRHAIGYSVPTEILFILALSAVTLSIILTGTSLVSAKTATQTITKKAESAGRISTNKSKAVQEIIDSIRLIQQGDLTVRLPEGNEFTRDISAAVNELAKEFATLVSEMKVMSAEMHSASAQSAQTAQDVERSREDQSRAVNEAFQLTKNVHSSISNIENSAKSTAESVRESRVSVNQGAKSVEETNSTISEMSTINQAMINKLKSMMDSVQGMNLVVDSNSQIASDIRLLALNLALSSQEVDTETAKKLNFTAERMNEFVKKSSESLSKIETVVSTVLSEAGEIQRSVEESNLKAAALINQSRKAKDAIMSIEVIASQVEMNSRVVEESSKDVAEHSQQVVRSMSTIRSYADSSSKASRETATAIDSVAKTSSKISERVNFYKVA